MRRRRFRPGPQDGVPQTRYHAWGRPGANFRRAFPPRGITHRMHMILKSVPGIRQFLGTRVKGGAGMVHAVAPTNFIGIGRCA